MLHASISRRYNMIYAVVITSTFFSIVPATVEAPCNQSNHKFAVILI